MSTVKDKQFKDEKVPQLTTHLVNKNTWIPIITSRPLSLCNSVLQNQSLCFLDLLGLLHTEFY